MDMLRSYLNKGRVARAYGLTCDETTIYLGGICLFVFVSIVWASVCEVDQIARMNGRIIPRGHSRPVQHLEGGIVSSVKVFEGSIVKEGDVLLTIDGTRAGASLGETESKLRSLRAKALRLRAEAQKKADIDFGQNEFDPGIIEEEKLLFVSKKQKLDQEAKIYAESLKQHQAALQEATDRKKGLSEELSVARKRAQMIENMVSKRAASQMEFLDALGQEKRIETEIRDAENAIPRIQAAFSEDKAKYEALLVDYRTKAQEELVSVTAEINRLEQGLKADKDRVRRTDLLAPIDGVVNRMAITSLGSVVKPGESVLEITPFSREVLVEGKLQPRDRGDIQAGASVKVRVSAHDVGRYGILSGQLVDISADTIFDTQASEPYFRTRVLIENIPPAYASRPLLPGMTVTADIITGRRTILSHVLSPLSKFATLALRDTR